MSDLGHLTETYHSLHVAPLQSQHERVAWRSQAPRADRIREHTCPCRRITYEFCMAGGLAFVRRTYRHDGIAVHESSWLQTRETEQLWLRILLGQAR
ncbi:hypothetical protein OHA77_19810 [Streptosporangium sp. NBC_01639]|uniref:hypothetical protein n=1 Tax=Streptosporangium sp. NBC_01639 TaxID=2975948 RepID=UPI003862F994|nr:hypothetical protein OHA77_19810 [Streptosporangium sp. NBC_01639]